MLLTFDWVKTLMVDNLALELMIAYIMVVPLLNEVHADNREIPLHYTLRIATALLPKYKRISP